MEEAQVARGDRAASGDRAARSGTKPAPVQAKGSVDVTPHRRRKTSLDELKEL
jgi:hypothetical protein